MPRAEWLALLCKHIRERYERLVRTIGWYSYRARIEPNATSIVPDYAEFDLQFRDASDAPLDALEAIAAILAAANSGISLTNV